MLTNEHVKFRMWDKMGKKMYNVGMIDFEKGLIYMENYKNYTQSFFDSSKVELLPYTGYKDKHDVEIYNKDIINIDGDIISGSYIIQYDIKHLRYYLFRISNSTEILGDILEAHLGSIQQNIEKIGSIYENPDLLENFLAMNFS